MENKIKEYNELRSQAYKLQCEIESYLDNEFGIKTLSSTDAYGMDGNCPVYEWGTEYFDIEQIKKIIKFKEEYYRRVGEEPDDREVSKYFAA